MSATAWRTGDRPALTLRLVNLDCTSAKTQALAYKGAIRSVIVQSIPAGVALSLRLIGPDSDPGPVVAGTPYVIQDALDQPWSGVWYDTVGASSTPAVILVCTLPIAPPVPLPLPIVPGTGAQFDVSDRAARLAGKVGIKVAGADVSAANQVPVSGKVGIQVASANVGIANPVPASNLLWRPDTGSEQRRTPNKFINVQQQAVTGGLNFYPWTPASGKKIRLLGFSFSISVGGEFLLVQESGTVNVVAAVITVANQPISIVFPNNGFLFNYANDGLEITGPATNYTMNGVFWGTEE